MLITVPLALLFGVVLAILLRTRSVGFGAAFIAVMFGFYLASTGAAKPINHLVASAATALLHLR